MTRDLVAFSAGSAFEPEQQNNPFGEPFFAGGGYLLASLTPRRFHRGSHG
jgi:hypothetical protein